MANIGIVFILLNVLVFTKQAAIPAGSSSNNNNNRDYEETLHDLLEQNNITYPLPSTKAPIRTRSLTSKTDTIFEVVEATGPNNSSESEEITVIDIEEDDNPDSTTTTTEKAMLSNFRKDGKFQFIDNDDEDDDDDDLMTAADLRRPLFVYRILQEQKRLEKERRKRLTNKTAE